MRAIQGGIVGAVMALLAAPSLAQPAGPVADASLAPTAEAGTIAKPPAEEMHIITKPDWISIPNVARFVPKIAYEQHQSGRAILRCKITAAGTLERCVATVETPPGMGFGEAALLAAPSFKMKPLTKDGEPVDGKYINIPVVFQLN